MLINLIFVGLYKELQNLELLILKKIILIGVLIIKHQIIINRIII
jgi:hypothetical protein